MKWEQKVDMGKLILGVDVKTKERIPYQNVICKKNMSDYEIDKNYETILLVSENSEKYDLENLIKFNFVNPPELIVFSKNNVTFSCEKINEETLNLYRVGKPIYLAIVDKRKKMIARYEI